MKLLITLPVLIPLVTAVLLLFMHKRMVVQRWISAGAMLILFLSTILLLNKVYNEGILVLQLGNWPAPFGITFVVDLLSAIMVCVTGFIGFNVAVYSLGSIDRHRERYYYYPLLHTLVMGVCGAFMTGDLFNLYVWFEVMLMSSFVLMALGGERNQLEGAIKYLSINFIASVFFLTAVGILYGQLGTLNLADIAIRLSAVPQSDLIMTSIMLLLIAFGVKAGLFPLFFWLPASYHTPPVPVSAIFAGLLTKVGIYALIRFLTLMPEDLVAFFQMLLLVISALTMLTGVLGAAAQYDFRKILSFHIISQVGYMTLGLAFFTPLALAAAVFYLFHHMIVKTNLFLISGLVNHIRGTYQLKHLGGLYRSHPLLAVLFLIPALSLGGIPPLSGFFAKFMIIESGLKANQYIFVAVALIVGVLTLYSMTKIWAEAFWKADPQFSSEIGQTVKPMPLVLVFPIIFMALMTIMIGFYPEPFVHISRMAGTQLLNPEIYINAVLGVP